MCSKIADGGHRVSCALRFYPWTTICTESVLRAVSAYFLILFVFIPFFYESVQTVWSESNGKYIEKDVMWKWEGGGEHSFLLVMKEKEDEKIPLKTILQNFLNHVETLEAKKEEGEDLYEKEFQVN